MSKYIDFNANEFIIVQDIRKIEVDRTVFPTVKGIPGGNISRAKMKEQTAKGYSYKIPCIFITYDGSKYKDELELIKIYKDPEPNKNRDLAIVRSKKMGQFILVFSSLLSGSFKKEFSEVYKNKAEEHNMHYTAWYKEHSEKLNEKATKELFRKQRDCARQDSVEKDTRIANVKTELQKQNDEWSVFSDIVFT